MFYSFSVCRSCSYFYNFTPQQFMFLYFIVKIVFSNHFSVVHCRYLDILLTLFFRSFLVDCLRFSIYQIPSKYKIPLCPIYVPFFFFFFLCYCTGWDHRINVNAGRADFLALLSVSGETIQSLTISYDVGFSLIPFIRLRVSFCFQLAENLCH